MIQKNKYSLYVSSDLYEKKIKEVKQLNKELKKVKQEFETTKQILSMTLNQKKELYTLLTEGRIILTRLDKDFVTNLYSSISDLKIKNKISFDIFFKKVVNYKEKWQKKKWPSLNAVN